MSMSERIRIRRLATSVVLALVAALAVMVSPVAPARADGNEAQGAPAAFRSITAGYGHTCALLANGTVKCWGDNSGQLGLGDGANRGDGPNEMRGALPVVNLGTGRTATAITAGTAHTCAVLDNGTVKCWGLNGDGELGLGDTALRGGNPGEMGNGLPVVNLGTGRTATAITAGYAHTCALLDNSQVKCWGSNGQGRLGLGDIASRGDGPTEMGDALPAVDLGTGRTATAITAGTAHTCALLDNGQVKCWGGNGFGGLGLGDTAPRGDNGGEMGDNLPAVDLGTGRTATAITAGATHTCALLDNATVKCWGANSAGELGRGDTADRGDNGSEMGDNLPAVDLGTGRTATAITAGQSFTCAVLDNATAKCWGGGGALGLGDTAARGDNGGEMGNNLPAVDLGTGRTATAITAGALHACAVLDNATAKCWGYNGTGQLGLGDTLARGDATNEMGDFLPVAIILKAAVSVTVTADQPSVVAGADIDYHVTIINTGGIPLTTVNVLAPDVLDCGGPVANVAQEDGQIVNCTYTTTTADVPIMTNQVLVTTAQGVFALSGTRRTRVDAQVFRPDAQIRLGAGAFAGDGVYNTTGASQTKSTTVANLGTATFTARIQNDGNVVDDFTLLGQATTSRYTVTYKDGATNITAAVIAGTFTLDDLAPGATHDITIQINAKAGTPVGNTVSRTLTTTSPASPASPDTVKATVRRT